MNTKTLWVSKPQEAVLLSKADRTLFLAGVGSGKSHDIALSAADFVLNHADVLQLICANTNRQLSHSTLKRVFDTWATEFGWRKGLEYTVDIIPPANWKRFKAPLKSYEGTICFPNGAMIFTASLENYKVLDGIEIGVAHLDETKDTREEAVTEVVVARLRQPGLWLDDDGILYGTTDYEERIACGRWRYVLDDDDDRQLEDTLDGRWVRSWTPLFIYTSPAKVDWLNLWFGMTDDYEEINRRIFSKTDFYHKENKDRCVVISSTYHNAANLPTGYIKRLLKSYEGNPARAEMLIYGSPIAKTGGEFVPMFRRLDHVGAFPFERGETAHVSLDFNVAPYMTLLSAQLTEGADGRRKVRVFAEYCLPSPNNNTEAVCKAFIRDYGNQLEGLFYYGDPSGRNRQTVTTEYSNNYDVVAASFRGYLNNRSDKVAFGHPGIIKSRDFLNKLFTADNDLEVDIEIDKSCKNLIHDLEYTKEDANGKMLKPKYKDPLTKQTYERYGHCLDALRYLVVGLLPREYDSFQDRA